MNAVYSKEYEDFCRDMEAFCTQERCDAEPYENSVEGGYRFVTWVYHGENAASVLKNELLDADGHLCSRWYTRESKDVVLGVVHHANGRDYLLFRCGLYGYSVLDRQARTVFRYLPASSFNPMAAGFQETFIWCKPFYDPKSNLMAVEGCLWAAPSSVIVLDFSKPMQAQETWVDVNDWIEDKDDGEYLILDFVRWDDDGLVVRASFEEDTNDMTIPFERIFTALKKGGMPVS